MSRGENSFAFDDRLIEYRSIGDQPRAKLRCVNYPNCCIDHLFFRAVVNREEGFFFPTKIGFLIVYRRGRGGYVSIEEAGVPRFLL